MRRQITLEPEVATELAGSEDAVLRALESQLKCDVFLRGNVLTLDGADEHVQMGEKVIGELLELIAQGHEISPGTIGAVTAALGEDQKPSSILGDVVWTHRNTRVAPKTVNQKRYVDSIRKNTITFGIGPAGTGKTYLAMAMATAALTEHRVNRIILTRPAVEAGERLGFLPGTMMEKVDPYLRPLFDALYDMLEADKVNAHLERGVIEVAPLAFMRGRTLNDSFIILDEAQNTSPEQMKMFLTRLGFNSTMVVTGDITQTDLPDGQRSGLVVVGDILQGVADIEFVRFGGEDVVRHKLVQRIVDAYSQHAEDQPRDLRSAEKTLSDALDIECPLELIAAAHAAAAAAGLKDGHLSVELIDSVRIAELNLAYRGLDEPTDVLSFPVDGGGAAAGPREIGDVVICPEHTADLEEATVHGVLHLAGFDHETDGGEMLALQASVLAQLGAGRS